MKVAKQLCLSEKENKKKAKRAKTNKFLDECKKHNGPVSESSLELLNSLNEKQLLSEVRYLRATLAPNIREKRKDGNKMISFTNEELINQIKNAIKPEAEVGNDVEELLSSIFSTSFNEKVNSNEEPAYVDDASTSCENENLPVGLVGQFSGPLEELSVGVVIASGNQSLLQLYESKRYGFVPSDLEAQPISEWTLVEEIVEYQYVNYASKPGTIFLKF